MDVTKSRYVRDKAVYTLRLINQHLENFKQQTGCAIVFRQNKHMNLAMDGVTRVDIDVKEIIELKENKF